MLKRMRHHSNIVLNVPNVFMSLCYFIGATMSVILDLSYALCIWISAAVAIVYTLLGGLYSVAYTDIIQLILIFFSLVNSLFSTVNFNNISKLVKACSDF